MEYCRPGGHFFERAISAAVIRVSLPDFRGTAGYLLCSVRFLRSTSFIDILNGTGLFDTGNQYVRCESVEGKKYDEVQKISIGLIALWFLFLTAATFWSVKEENKTLPSVWTEEAQEGSIEYEFPVDLEVSAADQAIGYISVYDNVPESLLQEGRDLLVGKVCSVIRKDDLYELTVDLYEKHSIGENVEGKIEITSEDVFPKVITRQAIHEGDFGKTCVYYIKRQKGAWGYENILEEKAVTCFPNRNSDFVVLLSEVDEPMVVSTSELTNGERVKLTEKD